MHPLVESKGSFGKHYSDMAYAAPRYTEAKLAPLALELLRDIDKNAVQRIESGKRFVTDIELVYFSNALNLSYEELLSNFSI